jgi:hypothetical protein
MNKYVIERTKEWIEETSRDWAKNFVVKAYQSQFDTADAKKQVDSAEFNMKVCTEKLTWLEQYLKTLSPKKKK